MERYYRSSLNIMVLASPPVQKMLCLIAINIHSSIMLISIITNFQKTLSEYFRGERDLATIYYAN